MKKLPETIEEEPTRVLTRNDWTIPELDIPWQINPKAADFFKRRHSEDNQPNMTWDADKLRSIAETSLHILAIKAMKGDVEAAEKLALTAIHATSFLTEICETKPELVRPLAQYYRQWPVFRKKRAELTEEEKDLFAGIKLGEQDFVENDRQAAKWIIDDAGKIAYSLIVYIRNARNDTADSMIQFGTFGKLPKRILAFPRSIVPHRRGAFSHISNLAKQTLKSDFTKDSASAWWKFAEELVLKQSYPNLLSIPELDCLVPKINKTKGKPLYKSTREAKILRLLKRRFISFAPNNYH